MTAYYQDKIESLRRIFGSPDVALEKDAVRVGDRRYPVLDDVIVLLEPENQPPSVRQETSSREGTGAIGGAFAPDIQFTLGRSGRGMTGSCRNTRASSVCTSTWSTYPYSAAPGHAIWAAASGDGAIS